MYLKHGPCLREFASVAEAAREMGISKMAIYHTLAGRTDTCAKKFDFYWEKINHGIDSF